MEEDKDTRLL